MVRISMVLMRTPVTIKMSMWPPQTYCNIGNPQKSMCYRNLSAEVDCGLSVHGNNLFSIPLFAQHVIVFGYVNIYKNRH
jgi:hypothetical protein